ncbi:MAG TPA: NADP-dependent glyceraldehyde-3-phosphate dehydrogenase [Williamwhitmania sp.]|nr:NADP-dependent glyceraldehyde-3-phosphate dehydrogenase [Williamwhitmania sp.]
MKQTVDSIFPSNEEIPEQYRLKSPVEQSEYLINGEIFSWKGESQKVFSPVLIRKGNEFDSYIGSYPLMGEKEAMLALDAATAAYNSGKGEWPSMGIEERIACMKNFVFYMKEQRDEIVKLLMWEIGKSAIDSAKEFDRTIDYILDTIDAVKNLDRDSSRFVITQQVIAQVRRAPLGVVLSMGPFNYPLNETFTTLIPALIMGNTVIFKPPRMGVLLHRPLITAFQKAFPKGVVNTIYGDGKQIITPLMKSGRVDVLAFIGTSRVADILKSQHPKPHRLKSILGLDAKNPAIVLADADIENAVKECITGSLSFNGQRCTALKILFVHRSIADAFVKRFSEEVGKLKLGMPWSAGVGITPLPEPNKSEFLTGLIVDATAKGAKVANPSGGYFNRSFFYPAVLFPVNKNMRVFYEEQFGPIVPIVPFDDINEPLDYVVESNYGQQASIFGQNPDTIATLIDTLVNQVCRVNVNSQCQRGPDIFPFTGRKDSAEGTLSVSDALRVFSIRTLVAAKENDENKKIITDIVREQKSNFLSTDFVL